MFMLEYNFNKLDDDFVTIWSQYVMFHDTAAIIEPLTRLAEKGQINAIQSWYLIKRPEVKNDKIDGIVSSYYGDSFNEALAIAHKIYDRDREKIQSLYESISYVYERVRECEREGSAKRARGFYNEANDLVKELNDTEYATQLDRAARLTIDTAKSSRLGFVWERAIELCEGSPLILGGRVEQKSINNVRKAMRKRLKENPQDISALFSLGKSLTFFDASKKEKLEGVTILRKLAARPLHIDQEVSSEDDGVSI